MMVIYVPKNDSETLRNARVPCKPNETLYKVLHAGPDTY